MVIPESQLSTWSRPGSITQSSNTYNSIKNMLQDSSASYTGKSYTVFLQGSYGNDTNIYSESDVDIVIRLDDTFYSNKDNLTEQEKSAYNQAFSSATYTLSAFKRDMLGVLIKQYGFAVNTGTKAITIDGNSSRRKADVIVSCQYRKYSRFRSASDSSYIEGICFFTSSGERIANYPQQHSTNLIIKHQATSSWLKPMIRIFKNMRSQLITGRKIRAGSAPSYYIEGLLYNVPNDKFSRNYQTCVMNVLNWYLSLSEDQKKKLVCANKEYYLLRDGYHVCWNLADCDAFIKAAVELWNKW
jgi:hypothetical protein